MKSWIQTHSGVAFDLANPTPGMVNIGDIATALSGIRRYTAHTRLTVAQHSVWVSQHCKPEHAFAGLMHDATEAYIGDISSPLKRLLGQAVKDIEAAVWKAIVGAFPRLPLALPQNVKDTDLLALATEKRDIMGPCPPDWSWGIDLPRALPRQRIEIWDESTAYNIFRARFHELTR